MGPFTVIISHKCLIRNWYRNLQNDAR